MTARQTFLRRLAVLVVCLLTVGILGRAAGTNESLPASRVIEGVVLPVPPTWPPDVPGHTALSQGSALLDAAARRVLDDRTLAPRDARAQLATVSSTR